jgi:hypothetical protein
MILGLPRPALLVLVALLGAAPAACAPSSYYAVTEGAPKRLPQENARLAVWGLRPVVTNTVVGWLRERGYIVIEPAELQQLFDRQNIRVSRSFADEQQAVLVAKQLDVALIIFTQSALGTTVVDSASATTAAVPYPGTMRTALSSASVALRGIEVASGELVLNGTAKYPQQLAAAGQDTLAILACKALETAWGLTPPGKQTFFPDEPCRSGRQPPAP